jgi:GNAT superfamily N-acetyltransferase
MTDVRIEPVPPETVRPLRHAVLRPTQGPEELVYPGDDLPGALHVAAREDREVVGIATVSPERHPHDPEPGDWRVRGMATTPSARGRGVGAALLDACVDHARARGGSRVWCTARVPAAGFYERAGFAVEGDEFELPDIGPHLLMARRL